MAREHELLFKINAQMGSSYQATFREAVASMGSLRDEYNALANTAKDIAAYQRQAQAVENTKAKLDLLIQQYQNIQKEIDNTGSFSSDLENKLASKEAQILKTTGALFEQSQTLTQYEEKLKEAGINTDDLTGESAKLATEMNDLRKGFDEASKGAEEMGASAADALNDLEGILVGAGLVKLAEELAEQLKACASASMEFEVGMAAVRRTVGGSEEEMAALGDEFQRMAAVMPITTSELTEIATTAGQLGIAQEDVKDFTRVMAELATTTDLSADKAATLLAQFSNITGTKDFDRLGSTVAALGDSTATTASRIVEMSQGMAAAASVAGMSAQDVLGISAAVGALGGRTQTGATAMSQLITKIQLAVETGEDLEGYANAAGMTAQQFKRAWGEDAAGALNLFINGLNDVERNGKTALAVLSDLGINNARQLRVFTGLARSGDMLTRTISLANQSWSENTALQEKAGIMYDTTRAKMTTMQNQVNNLRIAIGDQFNPALGRMYEIIGEAAGSLADFAEEHPEVVRGIGAITVALGVLTAGVGAATVAVKAFDLVANTSFGPVGWVMLGVSAVAALSAGIATLAMTADYSEDSLYSVSAAIRSVDDAVKSANLQVESAQEDSMAAAMTAGMYVDKLQALEEAGTATNESQQEYRAIISEINGLMPGLNAQIDEQTGLIMGGTDALRDNIEAWKQSAITQAIMGSLTETMEAWSELQLRVTDAQDKLNQAQKEGADIADSIARKEQAVADAMRLRNQLTIESAGSTEEFIRLQQEYDDQIYSLQNDLGNLAMEQEQNRNKQEELTLAVEEGTAAIDQYEGQMARAEEQAKAFAEGNQENADSLESMLGPLEDVFDSLDNLALAYNEAYEEAYKAVVGQFDLWDQAPEVVETSSADIIAALETQTQYWTDYSDNLNNLTGRNIEGLDLMVQALADGSEESANFIAGLASMSDEDLETVVEQFNQLGEAQQSTMDDLAKTRVDFDNAMKGMVDSAKSAVGDMKLTYDARQAALQTVNAYIDQANDMVGSVRASYAAVASAARDALNYGSMTVYGAPTYNNGYPTTTNYGHAGGTDNAPQGWRWVGEQGPELMYFQGGETVIPHTKSVEMLQSGDRTQVINVTLSPSYQISGAGNAQDIRAILEEHDRELPDKVTAILREAERDAVRRSYS